MADGPLAEDNGSILFAARGWSKKKRKPVDLDKRGHCFCTSSNSYHVWVSFGVCGVVQWRLRPAAHCLKLPWRYMHWYPTSWSMNCLYSTINTLTPAGLAASSSCWKELSSDFSELCAKTRLKGICQAKGEEKQMRLFREWKRKDKPHIIDVFRMVDQGKERPGMCWALVLWMVLVLLLDNCARLKYCLLIGRMMSGRSTFRLDIKSWWLK